MTLGGPRGRVGVILCPILSVPSRDGTGRDGIFKSPRDFKKLYRVRLAFLYRVRLAFLFGQRPRRGRSPVEHRGNSCPSVRSSVRPFVRSSVPPPGPGPLAQAPWPRPPSLGPTGPSLVKAGRMDGRTNGQEFPLCSTGLRPLRGRCPASIRIYTQITFQQTSTKAGQGYR